MGLDISHDAWHGAYSAFMRWRQRIAIALDYPPLELMEGFFQKDGYSDPIKDFAKLCPHLAETYYESLPIKWEGLRPSPIIELLHHSDCEGEIDIELLRPIADALEELLPRLEGMQVDDQPGGHLSDGYVEVTKRFIKGARAAASAQEPLEFA